MQVLTLDFEDDYSLIGIHSSEEDYRLAYLLNMHLKTNLTRFDKCLDFENSNAEFPLFEYQDKNNFINYYLINNKHVQLMTNEHNVGLFGGRFTSLVHLIPEKQNVDFFLQIEGCPDDEFIQDLIVQLKEINQIITSYSIDPSSLKSKEHLIF